MNPRKKNSKKVITNTPSISATRALTVASLNKSILIQPTQPGPQLQASQVGNNVIDIYGQPITRSELPLVLNSTGVWKYALGS